MSRPLLRESERQALLRDVLDAADVLTTLAVDLHTLGDDDRGGIRETVRSVVTPLARQVDALQ